VFSRFVCHWAGEQFAEALDGAHQRLRVISKDVMRKIPTKAVTERRRRRDREIQKAA